jgi:Prokaryotic Cytochrome C oxidase subunit IV
MSTVLRAWIVLVVASAATTALAVFHATGVWAMTILLVLALVKSRVILSDYLRLSEAPPIRRGFMAVLMLWAALAFALAFTAQS